MGEGRKSGGEPAFPTMSCSTWHRRIRLDGSQAQMIWIKCQSLEVSKAGLPPRLQAKL